jgi:hypothetical protein
VGPEGLGLDHELAADTGKINKPDKNTIVISMLTRIIFLIL